MIKLRIYYVIFLFIDQMSNSFKTIVKYSISFIAAFIIWNLIIGNFIYNQTSEYPQNLGDAKMPNSRFVFGTQGFSDSVTDNYGYNNDYIPPKSGLFRIVVLGDSITEAAHVNRKINYCSVLEKKLNGQDKKYEVLNLGRAGRSVADYIGFALDYMAALDPDLVIVQAREADFAEGLNAAHIFQINYQDENHTTLNKIGASGIFQDLKYLKDGFGWFRPIVGYTALRVQEIINNQKTKIFPSVNAQASAADSVINSKEKAVIAWQLQQLEKKFGSHIALFNIELLPEIVNGKVRYDNGIKDNELNSYLAAEAEKEKIPFITAKDTFIDYYKKTGAVLTGFNNSMPGTGHLNKTGHEVAANILADYILNAYPQ